MSQQLNLLTFTSPANYSRYNIALAHVVGLETAVYIEQLLKIYEKAIKKEKLVNGMMTVDRKYITEETTLPPAEQRNLDAQLQKLGIVTISEKSSNCLSLNPDKLLSLFISIDPLNEEAQNVSTSRKTRSRTKEVRAESIKESLRGYFDPQFPDEVLNSLNEWMDEVFPTGKLSASTVKKVVSDVQKMAPNTDMVIQILQIAMANKYVDLTYAINSYKLQMSNERSNLIPSSTPSTVKQVGEVSYPNVVSHVVNKDIVF